MNQHAQQHHDTEINKPMAFKAGRTEEKGQGTKFTLSPLPLTTNLPKANTCDLFAKKRTLY
ncbi:hypothetical protein D1Z90_15840 [Motilimonas pumila]|uniref:Uncharacterized protein n=1 Tax=Motilimonas pumila TaxID=2303987 RepID=A0A418YBG9_9GAMM|nr:hypothetical protein D1Z90_15840 [Motilimonas pumila]